jgi:hypothetical protein
MATNGPFLHPQMTFEYEEPQSNDTESEKPKNSEKKFLGAILPITNPTCSDPGASLVLRGERQATNHASYGTAPMYKS